MGKRAGLGLVHPHVPGDGFILARPRRRRAPAPVQVAARRADPHTTTVHDHRRQDLDRDATYVVVAFVAGG
jgi:hypothetical protein